MRIMNRILVLSLTLITSLAVAKDANTLAITHVTVINVVDGSAKPETTIIVRRDRIAEIKPSSRKRIKDAEVIDGHGKFLGPREAIDLRRAKAQAEQDGQKRQFHVCRLNHGLPPIDTQKVDLFIVLMFTSSPRRDRHRA